MKIYAPILLFVISIFLSLLIVKEYFFDVPQCAINTDCATCAKANGCAWCLNKSACVPTDRMGYPLYRDCTDKDLVTFENNCNRVSTSDMRTTTISTEGTGSTGNGNANWADRVFNYDDSSDTLNNDSGLNLGANTWLENNESPYESSDGDSWNKNGDDWWNTYWNNYRNYWNDASGNDASGNSYDSNDASGNQTCSSKKNCKSCASLDDCAWCTDTNTCVVTERGRSVGNDCSDMKLLSFVNDCPASGSGYSSSGNNSGYRWRDYNWDYYKSNSKLYDSNGHDLSCLNNQQGNSKITGRPCKDLDPAYSKYINSYRGSDLDPSGNEWGSDNVPGNKFLKNANGKDVTCIDNRYGRSKISGLLCRYTDSSGNIQERFGVEKFGNYKPTNIIQKIISEQLKRNGLPSIETFTGSITETIRNAIRLK